MKYAAPIDILKQPLNTTEGSFYGGNNPFYDIEMKNRDRLLKYKTNKEKIQLFILREFDAWDLAVSIRLKQLIEAVLPELHHTPHLRFFRMLSKQNLFWMIFGRLIKYRIVRNRNEGMWELEFFNPSANSDYGQNDLVRVRFHLDDRFKPIGFHLCRGSDNKIFSTSSLSEDELTRTLVCHFSRLSCGSNQQDDIDHLRYLHDNKVISTTDYAVEKQSLLSNRMTGRLYVLPAKPAPESINQKAQAGLFLAVLGVLMIGVGLWCAHKLTYADAKSSPLLFSLSEDIFRR